MAQLFKVGAYGTDDITTIIALTGFIATDGNVTHLRLPFSTTGYQVTVGKTLYMVKVVVMGTGNQAWWKVGYADNDVGFNTATARTNPVMCAGIDDTNQNGFNWTPANVQTSLTPQAIDQIPHLVKIAISNKFPFIRRVGPSPTDQIFVWCIEL